MVASVEDFKKRGFDRSGWDRVLWVSASALDCLWSSKRRSFWRMDGEKRPTERGVMRKILKKCCIGLQKLFSFCLKIHLYGNHSELGGTS